MKISIFGLGYVGCVSMGCLAQLGHDVTGIDVSENKVQLINSGKPTIIEKDIEGIIDKAFRENRIRATTDHTQAILGSEISIVAVGTPSSETGHLNLAYVFNVAKNIGKALAGKHGFHIIALRSTVLPGTCEKVAGIIAKESGKQHGEGFAVLANPEFLREGSAVRDYYNPPYTLIGGGDIEACRKLAQLYTSLPAEVVITKTRNAEIMKYLNNSFHALKISFANEVGNICQAVGIDSHEVMRIFVMDLQLNLSPYYLKPGFAYGGSCLPKDLKALQTLAHDHYVEAPVIEHIHKTNEAQIGRAVRIIEQFRGKRIGFLGLSFKAGTDDLRNSPAVNLIETLLGKGFGTRIFDRNIHVSRLTGTNKDFIDQHIPHLSKLLVSTPEELLDFADVLVVNTGEEEFIPLLENEHQRMIVDLVRISDTLLGRENYLGINW